MKTLIEEYIEQLCSICKNKQTDMCCIVRKIDNSIGCEYYKKDKPVEGHKEPIKPFNHFRGETTKWY